MTQAVGDRLSESNTHSNLSKLALQRGEPASALAHYRILASSADERRSGLLADAYRELQSRASSIPNASLRESFLTRIPENRQIVAAWEAEHGGRNTR